MCITITASSWESKSGGGGDPDADEGRGPSSDSSCHVISDGLLRRGDMDMNWGKPRPTLHPSRSRHSSSSVPYAAVATEPAGAAPSWWGCWFREEKEDEEEEDEEEEEEDEEEEEEEEEVEEEPTGKSPNAERQVAREL